MTARHTLRRRDIEKLIVEAVLKFSPPGTRAIVEWLPPSADPGEPVCEVFTEPAEGWT